MAGFSQAAVHARVVGLVLAVCATTVACFDADQTEPASIDTGTTTGVSTSGMAPDPWTTGQGGSVSTTALPPPDATCRDAIECVTGCAAGLPMPLPPEPDLSCFLECETGLNEEEALALLRLTDCVARECAEKGLCTPDAGTTGGATGGSDTGTSGTTTGGDTGPIDPCTDCILTSVLDPQPPGCLDEAAACD